MKNKRQLKLSHILKILFVIILLISVFFAFYVNIFILRRLTNNEIAREEALLENSVDLWERNINLDLNFMYDYLTTNYNVIRLHRAETESEFNYALQDIQFELKKYNSLNYGMEEIFFYNSAYEKNSFVSSYYNNNDSSMLIKDKDIAFVKLCEEDGSVGGWTIKELSGKNYLLLILNRGSNYLGCWSSVDYLLEDFAYGENDPLANHVIFITDKQGLSVTDSYMNGIQIDLDAKQGRNPETNEQYQQISHHSDIIPICFVEHISQSAIESAISYVRSTMIIISIALVAIVSIWWILLDYILYRPIRNLVRHMSLLSAGDFDTRITEKSRLYETSLLYDTFNNMVQEIQNLKISVYEHQLLVQKIKVEYLQIQIHPHFLVNGINSVSAMIDMSMYNAAKEMCAYLAEYYRYQYQLTEGMIPLQNEIRQVDLYLNIQKLRHPGKMDYHIEVDDECTLVPIPPISILSFAGNSFKYGMNRTTLKTEISIKVKKTESSTYIEIRDKGPGFPDEILQKLERREPIYQKERECIGMRNAMGRLYLFYDGKATCRPYNDGGAVVAIIIPDHWDDNPTLSK